MARRTAHSADHGLRGLAAVLPAGPRAETRVTAVRVFSVAGRDTGGLLRANATSQTCVYPARLKKAIALCHGRSDNEIRAPAPRTRLSGPMICFGALRQLRFVDEAPAYHSHRDARHRPAGVCGRICGDLLPDVAGLPNLS